MENLYIPILGKAKDKFLIMGAFKLAKKLNLKPVFVYLLDTYSINKLASLKIFVEEEQETMMEALKRDVETYRNLIEKLKEKFGINAEIIVIEGNPVFSFLEFIEKNGVKMVAIAKETSEEFNIRSFTALEKKLLSNENLVVFVIGSDYSLEE